jgi:hypothetical protein
LAAFRPEFSLFCEAISEGSKGGYFIQFVKRRQTHRVRVSFGREPHVTVPHQFHRHSRRYARTRQHRCKRVPQRMEINARTNNADIRLLIFSFPVAIVSIKDSAINPYSKAGMPMKSKKRIASSILAVRFFGINLPEMVIVIRLNFSGMNLRKFNGRSARHKTRITSGSALPGGQVMHEMRPCGKRLKMPT